MTDLTGRLTCSVPEAGQLLGIGRDAAYAAAARGEIPTLRLGRSIRVSVPALLALLGATPDMSADPEPTGPSTTTQHEVSGGPHNDNGTAQRLYSA
jgi:excisionase family DNA binding protein